MGSIEIFYRERGRGRRGTENAGNLRSGRKKE
jgi:hypothetical protein